ncbi:hypothetical protein PM082_020371 [Marasmius tenuissimus]|nr:hypothetical protein PM082_020371 [Marasmius tenuissimus]
MQHNDCGSRPRISDALAATTLRIRDWGVNKLQHLENYEVSSVTSWEIADISPGSPDCLLFYAYAKNINDDWSWRYLIVFATRAVADEWWRAVSTSSNTAYSGTVVRVTPQFYTHDPSRANIAYSINDASVAKKFLGTVIFTLLPDRDGRAFQLIQPSPEPITDYISNSWFYIRSKGDRSVYWHCNNKGTIVASRTNSTRFLVRNTDHSFDGKVMINPDDITLSLASGKLSVHVTDAGNLQASPKADKFKFGDFLDGYSINGNGWIIVDGLPDNAIVKVNDNSGEAWELVMNGRVYE